MDRKEFGFWRSLRKLSGEDLLGAELLWACIIGIGGGVGLHAIGTTVKERIQVANDFLVVVAPLLAVVFAAFALVMALLSDNYLRVLKGNDGGILAFFRPFLVAIGIEVGTVIGIVIYRTIAEDLPSKVEVAGSVGLCFLFVFTLFDVVALAKNVLAHGATRAEELEVRDLEEQARSLRDKRRGR